jgi:hypothetical protein
MLRGLAGAMLEVTPNKFNERRVRRFTVSCRDLVAIFSGRVKIDDEPVPADAEVGHVAADFPTDAVAVYVYSDEYPSVPDGEEIPDAGLIGLRMYQYPPDESPVSPDDPSWRSREALL